MEEFSVTIFAYKSLCTFGFSLLFRCSSTGDIWIKYGFVGFPHGICLDFMDGYHSSKLANIFI